MFYVNCDWMKNGHIKDECPTMLYPHWSVFLMSFDTFLSHATTDGRRLHILVVLSGDWAEWDNVFGNISPAPRVHVGQESRNLEFMFPLTKKMHQSKFEQNCPMGCSFQKENKKVKLLTHGRGKLNAISHLSNSLRWPKIQP